METPSAAAESIARKHGSYTELSVVFGLTVVLPLLLAVMSREPFMSYDFGQRRLLTTVAVELALVAVLWPWLAARGWSFRTIAGAPEPRDVARGIGVAVIAYLTYYVSAITWAAFVPSSYEALLATVPTGTAAAWVVVTTSVINSTVEEFLWLGYGVTALTRYGVRIAVATSVSLRLAVHLYQGMLAFIGVLPLALVFTMYYVRTKRLWPVVVAHVLFDVIGLLAVIQR